MQAYPNSWIEIAYGYPKPNAASHFSAFKLEEAIAFAEKQNRAGLNIYVGPALRHGERPSGRSNKTHVLAASHAWSEYEGAGDDERIDAILKDKGLIPAIVLTTGTVPYPRRHLYFKLGKSTSPNDVEAANASLQELLATDNVKDFGRVMRLAGTVSYPTPDKQARGYVAELVKLMHRSDAPAYPVDELIVLTDKAKRFSDTRQTRPRRRRASSACWRPAALPANGTRQCGPQSQQ